MSDYHDDGNSLVVGINGNSGNNAGMSIIAGDTSSASKLYFGDGTEQAHTVVILIIGIVMIILRLERVVLKNSNYKIV